MSKIGYNGKWWNESVNFSGGCSGCELTPLGEKPHCWALTMAWRLAHIAKTRDRYEGLVKLQFTKDDNGRFVSYDGLRWTGKTFCDLDILRKAAKRGKPTIYFVGSMTDFFYSVPEDKQIEAFSIMAESQQHQWLILTKLPKQSFHIDTRMLQTTPRTVEAKQLVAIHNAMIERRLWLGVSVTDQSTADERIRLLIAENEHGISYWQGPTFISAEPLLGPIVLKPEWLKRIGWMIIGCESGPGARPTRREWVRPPRDQCVEAGIPVFIKQLCFVPPRACDWPSCASGDGTGKLIHSPKLDGQQWLQMPESLR